jgi:hypothetical protein
MCNMYSCMQPLPSLGSEVLRQGTLALEHAQTKSDEHEFTYGVLFALLIQKGRYLLAMAGPLPKDKTARKCNSQHHNCFAIIPTQCRCLVFAHTPCQDS